MTSEVRGGLRGGKCWFAVESKTFEISIEGVQGRPRGIILERSRGFSSWIRFGERSLSYLLEGVEAWCRGESSSRCLKGWEDGGRKFRLECCSNEVGRFLLCFVRDLEAKKFCLVVLEGKGLVGGWFLLAKKLRALGVSTPTLTKVFFGHGAPTSEKVGCSFIEKVKGTCANATRVKTRESGETLWPHLRDQEFHCREE